MGIFDKLAFWKKKDDFGDLDLGKDLGKETLGDFPSPNSQSFGDSWNQGGFDQQPQFPQSPSQPSFGQSSQPSFGSPSQPSFSSQSQPSFTQPSFSSPSYSSPSYSSPSFSSPKSDSDYINSKSLEVISSKIDALRAAIESMNARLANIERIAGQEEDSRRRRYY